jgi:BirA family transcriptional regulator, biotin operon repressor / biotin---[acetyl-CoA-carboxylase] ligase
MEIANNSDGWVLPKPPLFGTIGSSAMDFDPPLSSVRIGQALAGQEIGGAVQVHEELGSTSDLARELGQAGHPHGTVVIAEHQSAGRGRRENSWSAGARKNLLLSVLLRPALRMELWPRVTTLAALALCRAIEGQCGLQPSIKWPNDIFLGDRKCAGILAETFSGTTGAFLVLGMGVNVHETAFPPELKDTATSLKLAPGGTAKIDRDALVIALLRQLGLLVREWDSGYAQVVAEVRRRSWLLGRHIMARMNSVWVQGKAVDLDDEGHLQVRQEDGGLLTLASADQVRPCP